MKQLSRYSHWFAVAMLTGWAITKLHADITDGNGTAAVISDSFAIIVILGLGLAMHTEQKISHIARLRADLNRERADTSQAAFLNIVQELTDRLTEEHNQRRSGNGQPPPQRD